MPDFFALSKLLPLIFYPLPFLVLIIFIASWWIKNNAARWLVRLSVTLLWILGTPWAADELSGMWETPRSTLSSLPASDVAIVLGGLSELAVSTPEHIEFNGAVERITEAVALWKMGKVKAILITSGSGELWNSTEKEAPQLAAWAISMGVDSRAVFVESESRNTYENATLSLPLALRQDFKSFILVTSAVHMPRSAAIFRKAGYTSDGRTLVVWPVDTQLSGRGFPFNLVPQPAALATVQSVIKEIAGYVIYAAQGYL